MAREEYLFTSESVTEGHPDKIADQISDAVLDAIIGQDPKGRGAGEGLLTTGLLDYVRPDGKSQVTVRYVDGKPRAVETVVISSQHSPDVAIERIRRDVVEHVIVPTIPSELLDPKTCVFHVNPTGRFVTGGPMGDTGLTGRKIIVDTYGGAGPRRGGAVSGRETRRGDPVPRCIAPPPGAT